MDHSCSDVDILLSLMVVMVMVVVIVVPWMVTLCELVQRALDIGYLLVF